MNNNKRINTLKIALLGLTATAIVTMSASTLAAKAVKMEKCTGIVKKGKADGQQMFNGKKVDWIHVPAGACEKFVDGVVIYENK